jgi:myo-inositol-1(or 4)-monophosphatase
LEQIKQVAFKAAREAGAVLKQRVGHIKSLNYKGAFDIVTDVDKESERLVIATIREKFPDHQILGEESGAHISNSLKRWIIDPLDGTTNFAHGYPFFSVSIGFEDSGEMAFGVVYNPISDELFWAQKGKGAYLNDAKISVSSTDTVNTSLLCTGFPADSKTAQFANTKEFAKLTDLSHGVRRDGSAALDLSFVACGRLDGFWELKLAPWDMAAGTLLVQEAGGKITNVSGGPFDLNGKHVVATNGKIHVELVRELGFNA